ncbi:tripartite tricarboxylate transporter substrate binding protein [Xanthobacter sp. V4C-4]|uniref:Bug family tripartite tricarboxylate transporter substrate binding protein n=1 Tax=Xanthobacter cornucopiae TaxID=3119924 RepID=UPI00372BC041
MLSRRSLLQHLAIAAAAGGALNVARARAAAGDYPSRPIKIIATYQPGGTNDIMARLAADIWSKALDVPVTVENRPGGNGSLGTSLVAHAKADGYTLLAGTFGPVTVLPTLTPDIGYDPLKDLAPVGILATAPNVIIVHPSLPATTLPEFIALAKARADNPFRFGVVPGGTPEFLVEVFKTATGITLVNVPYKGGTSALNDLIGNHIDFYIDNVPLVLPQIRGGTVRALALASPTRSPVLPEVPTTVELGYPDAVILPWHGILAPGGTPEPIIALLNAKLVEALRTPPVIERITSQGASVVANSPAEFAAFLKAEVPRWAQVIRTSGLTAR